MNKIILKSGETLIIREAVKEDAANIIDYVNQVASESSNLTFGRGEFNITIEEEEEILEKGSKSQNSLFIAATINDEIVGYLTFIGGKRQRIEHFGEFGVNVAKKYWNKGIGRALLDYLINWAKDTGIIKKINLKVRTDNTSAIKLYEKLGFVIEGRITRHFIIDGEYYDVYVMGLEVE